MNIQVIHQRDPDIECAIEVYVDGVRVLPTDVEDIDPGRGYTWSTWRERLTDAQDAALADPDDGYKVAVHEALLSATASPHITGKPDNWMLVNPDE